MKFDDALVFRLQRIGSALLPLYEKPCKYFVHVAFLFRELRIVPQTGLALWGSQDIALVPWISPTLWSRAVAELPRSGAPAISGPGPAQVRPRLGQGLGVGIWKSGDLEIQKLGIQKLPK